MGALLAESAPLPQFIPGWLGGGFMWKVCGGIFVLILLLRFVLSRPPKVREFGESGGVVGFIGKMGGGKTYAAVRAAHENLLAGVDVYTNFTMHLRHNEDIADPEHCPHDCELPVVENAGRWTLIRSMDDVGLLRGEFKVVRGRKVLVRRFVVIIDEVQDLCSADHGTLSDTTRFTVKNIRKFGGDLYWTSQSAGGVHSRLKALTHRYGVCTSIKSARKGRKFKVTYFDELAKIGKEGKHLYCVRYSIDQNIAGLYDTSEVVVPDEDYVDGRLSAVLVATGVRADGPAGRATKEHGRAGGRQATGSTTATRRTPKPVPDGAILVGGTSGLWGQAAGIRGSAPPTP